MPKTSRSPPETEPERIPAPAPAPEKKRQPKLTIPLLVLIGTQVVFTCSDLLGRAYMRKMGFQLSTFLTPWFLLYFALRQVAMFMQLYVFAYVSLGKTIAVLAAAAIFFSNIFGYLFLQEVLQPAGYVGVSLALAAVLVLALTS